MTDLSKIYGPGYASGGVAETEGNKALAESIDPEHLRHVARRCRGTSIGGHHMADRVLKLSQALHAKADTIDNRKGS